MISENDFLEYMNSGRVLTQEEEKSVFLYYKEHKTRENRNQIAALNTGIIWNIINSKGYAAIGDRNDIYQEGYVGLLEAIEQYNPESNVRFYQYASKVIRNTIIKYLNNSDRMIKLPPVIRSHIGKIRKEETRFLMEYNRKPTIQELADILQLPIDTIEEIVNVHMREIDSIDADLDEPVDDSLYQKYSLQENRETISKIMKENLSDEEFHILSMLYGMNGYMEHTPDEIAKQNGMTRRTVIKDIRKAHLILKRKIPESVRA